MDFKVSLATGATVSTRDFYSGLGKRYEDAYGHNPGLQDVVQHFLSLLPGSAIVLDCGCGTGKPVSFMIAQSGRRPYGIDLSETMVELSRKQIPQGTFQTYNMLNFAAPPEIFDGITVIFSLFGLTRRDITSMGASFLRWLRPGGHLLLGVFCAEDCNTKPEQYDADGECAHGVESTFMAHKSYMTLFTKTGWNRMLEDVGFEIVHSRIDTFETPTDAVCDDDPYYYIIARKPSDS